MAVCRGSDLQRGHEDGGDGDHGGGGAGGDLGGHHHRHGYVGPKTLRL